PSTPTERGRPPTPASRGPGPPPGPARPLREPHNFDGAGRSPAWSVPRETPGTPEARGNGVLLPGPDRRPGWIEAGDVGVRFRSSEEHTSELQSRFDLVCRL